MPTETNMKIPAPIYAAAGAGDLAIERLRKLPARVAVLQERVNALQDELPGRFNVLQDKVTQKVAELPSLVAELRQRFVDTDTDKIRQAARRNANVVVSNAQAAQERAASIYADLVTRGEHVVGHTMPESRSLRVVAGAVPSDDAKAREAKAREARAHEVRAHETNAHEANGASRHEAQHHDGHAHSANGQANGYDANGHDAKADKMGTASDTDVVHTLLGTDTVGKSEPAKRAAKGRKNI